MDSNNQIIELLKEGKKKGVSVFLEGENLKIKKNKQVALDPDFMSQLKGQRDSIKSFLMTEAERQATSELGKSKIVAINREGLDSFPLSYAQERLWLIDKMWGSTNYNLFSVIKFKGDLKVDFLEESFREIVNRHEVFRSVVLEENEEPRQRLLPADAWKITRSNFEGDGGEEAAQLAVRDLLEQPFDLSNDYMLRVALLQLKEDEFIVAIVFHHIASDAWSESVLVREFIELYTAKVENRDPKLTQLNIQYTDYAAWERSNLEGSLLNHKLTYWEEQLKDVEPLNLPLDFNRKAEPCIEGDIIHQKLDKVLSQQLVKLAKQEKVTLYMLMLSAFKVLLYRYTGQTDICVGTSLANRDQKEVESLIGFFVNMLALRSKLDTNLIFTDLLSQVKETTLDAFSNKEIPFHMVVNKVDEDRDSQISPIFQTLFVLNNTPEAEALSLPGLDASVETVDNVMTHFDLGMYVTETPSGMSVSISYFTDLFAPETIDRMLNHYVNLLHEIVENPGLLISELKMLNATDLQQVLEKDQHLRVPYPKERTITTLFEDQVNLHPNQTALSFEGRELTYRELNEKANELCAHLRSVCELEAGARVGFLLKNPFWQLISMLAILKSGATYVPIDIEYPDDRKSFIIKDTALKALIAFSAEDTAGILSEVPTLLIDEHQASTNKYSTQNSFTPVDADQAAYIIYTSGTSGQPKGVMVSHQNIVDYIYGLDHAIQISDCVSFGLMSSMTADLGNTVLFGALLNGKNLHVFEKEILTNPTALHPYFKKHSIDCIKIVPSHWRALIVDEQCLLPKKMIVFGGEVLSPEMLQKIKKANDQLKVVNHYGPTETTIGKLLHVVDLQKNYDTVPIGQPFSNSQVYVVNKELLPCPTGVAGELLIGGDGVALGYLNQPDLTAQKFINNPFDRKASSKLYRTGDRVRRLANGEVAFLGRVDDQVKIRGYRVEPAGIELVLNSHPAIRQSVVIPQQEENGLLRLVAYIVSESEMDQEEIRAFLQNRLPDYMVPSIFISLDELPLTSNGKINKKALPDPSGEQAPEVTKVAPRNDLEQSIAAIWEKLLSKEQIGVHESFFEIGGHSLIAIRVVLAIRKQLKKEIAIKDIFEHKTIASLATFIQEKGTASTLPPLTATARPEKIPLSDSQERLWIIDKLSGSNNYHIDYLQGFSSKLDVETLEFAFKYLVERHEVLRTVLIEEEGTPYQKVLEAENWKLDYQIINEVKWKACLKEKVGEFVNHPFDLSADYMLRCCLYQLPDQSYLLALVMHHIASDVWSRDILTREFMEVYQAKMEGTSPQLPPMSIQYADYAIWQRKHFTPQFLEKQLSYWKTKLEGVQPLGLPTDFPRPRVQGKQGKAINFEVGPQLVQKLKTLCQAEDATFYMLLLTAFKVALFRYTEQTDICVGSPVANRTQKESEGLIGFFLNALALRTDLSGNPTFIQLLKKVRKTILDGHSHQNISFEKVVDSLDLERDMSRTPLFQVWFDFHEQLNLYGKEEHKLDQEQKDLFLPNQLGESADYHPSKFDIDFVASTNGEGLRFSLTYCIALFKEETIQQFKDHFLELLKDIARQPDQKIASLNILSAQEKQALLALNTSGDIDYPRSMTMVDVLSEQFRQYPDRTAVVFNDQKLSYKELDQQSNQLAHYLQHQGIGEENMVGVCFDRSIEMIVAILAVVKAGAVYVPIDPAYPQGRISYMLSDSNTVLVLTSSSLQGFFKEFDHTVLLIDEMKDDLDSQPVTLPPTQLKPENGLYVIYTSGSTGQPKGVLVEHKNLVRLFKNEASLFDFGPDDVWTLFHSFCFDFSVWEMYGALSFGGTLVVVPKEVTKDPSAYCNLLLEQGVTVLNQTPGSFYGLQEYFLADKATASLRYVIFGGEALAPARLKEWHETYPDCKLINMYGITETTVHVTYKEIGRTEIEKGISNIGKAIPTLECYILDAHHQMMPMGVPGEIFVGGAGLARLYLNRPELTAERFIENPFKQGARMYKTGDIGKWLPDGSIEYIGRKDEQVKIRGFRIELGEIESAIKRSGLVSQCIVLAKADSNNNKRLVGYVIPIGEFDKDGIQSFLRTCLPDYMVPAVLVELTELPLTSNGKIDKKALPEPDAASMVKNHFTAPRSEAESQLADIWKGLLNVDKVGVFDNFFELGGDSIISIQVVSRARKSGLELQPKDVFECQTIAALAQRLEQQAVFTNAEQGPLEGAVELLPIQNWFLSKDPKSLGHYNQSQLLNIDKRISQAQLNAIVDALVKQHDALRFKYEKQEGKWMQTYGSNLCQLEAEDLRHLSKEEAGGKITALCQSYQSSLDIQKGALIKAVWMQTPAEDENNRLFLVIHHLAVDGVSWRILLEQIQEAIESLQAGQPINFGKKSSSFRQWAETLKAYAGSDLVHSELDYWLQSGKAYEALPVDYKVEASKPLIHKEKKQLAVSLSEASTNLLLKHCSHRYNTRVDDLLISALWKTISDWCGRSQLVIGMEGHGREFIDSTIDTTNTVGWFTTLYPIHLNGRSKSPEMMIPSIKEQLRKVPGKGIGFGLLRDRHASQEVRDKLLAANWDIVFNYLGQADNVVNTSALISGANESRGENIGPDFPYTGKFQINSIVGGGQLHLSWAYSMHQYEEATIKQLADTFIANLEEIILHCQESEQSVKTPSDFGLAPEVDYQAFQEFLASKDEKGQRKGDLISAFYRLSPLQEGILFQYLFDKKSKAYIEQMRLDFPEGVNVEALRQSFQYTIDHFSILRTGILAEEWAIPVQCVYKKAELPFELIDFRQLTKEDQENKYADFLESDFERGFDFNEAPLMRLTLIQTDENHYKMVWTFHHILLDGWSKSVVVATIMEVYERYARGQEPERGTSDEYGDYIRYIEQTDKYSEEKFWQTYLDAYSGHSLLPFVDEGLAHNSGDGLIKDTLRIDGELTSRLKNYAQQEQLTVNTLLQGAWSFLLSTYTGEEDVLFGVTVSGRPTDLAKAEKRVGLYINTLPLRAKVNKEEKVADWLRSIQRMHTEAREYQYTSLNSIKQRIGTQGELFDSILIFENYPISEVLSEKERLLKVGEVKMKEQSNFLLTITVGLDNEMDLMFRYNEELLSASTIKMIQGHFRELLTQLAENKKARLGDLDPITARERKQLLPDLNAAKIAYPKEKTVVDLFSEQVTATPDRIALSFNGRELSYAELNDQAGQLANYLQKKGVKENGLVGIALSRSVEMLVGILGILKAGGTYVPIDPEYPVDRIDFIVKDAGLKLMLTTQDHEQLFGKHGLESILLDTDRETIEQESPIITGVELRPEHSIYVIYTSGTTGLPKGVVLEHRNVVRLFKTDQALFDFGPDDVWTLFHSFCFDFSVWEIFGALLFGGKLVIVPTEVTKDSASFARMLAAEKVTVLNQTPASFYSLKEECISNHSLPELRYVIFGGEALAPAKLGEWKATYPQCKLINMYGITETTVHVTYKEINAQEIAENRSNIGTPIPTLYCYILDKEQKLLPVGVSGEIYVGGEGVARNYLNRPALSKERFIKNPFDPTGDSRLYKTGDLARYLPNGDMEYMGRKDDQVKIRGYRVELGEIENVLNALEQVSKNVVLAKEDASGNKRLIAYVVPNGVFAKQEILTFLQSKLPAYMVPALIVELEAMPMTANGKLDKAALPDPEASSLIDHDFIAPRNELEEALSGIWMEVLQLDQVGMNDDFFELGGHSLLATRVVSAIRKALKVDIETKDLFIHPTIEELAELIEDQEVIEGKVEIEKVAVRPARIPLSYGQERLWIIDRLGGSTQYHIPKVQWFNNDLNPDILEQALGAIVDRHEILRTVIYEAEGQPYQRVLERGKWELNFNMLNEEANISLLLTDEISRPFNLNTDHPLRASLYKLADGGYYLALVLHHIAADGWSMNILINEFLDFYNALLKNQKVDQFPLDIQYADYALWQRATLSGEVLEEKLDYWEKQLEGSTSLKLPLDYKRPAIQSTKGAAYNFGINTTLTSRLNQLCKEQGVTLYMLLLSAFNVLLHRYSGQSDICIGSPVANRDQKELEYLIGFFVNTIALRTDVKGTQNFNELLGQVKQTVLDAYSFQDAPFEKIVERIVTERDRSMSPVFQVMFALQNAPNEIRLEGASEEVMTSNADAEDKVPGVRFGQQTSKFDLTLYAFEMTEGLSFSMEYCTDLFKEETIQRFCHQFEALLIAILDAPTARINQLKTIGAEEEKHLLIDFNDTAYSYPDTKSIVELFADQVQRGPDRVALVFGKDKLTYAELDQRSTKLAAYLNHKGIRKGDLVGICIDRSFDMITGVLAILKAGGIYVPIARDLPTDRMKFIIEDTALGFILTNHINKDLIPSDLSLELLLLEDSEVTKFESSTEITKTVATDSVYLMYTSGSSGQPKGVVVKHQAISRLIFNKTFEFLDDSSVLYQYAPLSFDASTFEIWGALLKGGTLVLSSKEQMDLDELEVEIKEQKVNVLWLTSGLFHMAVEICPSLFIGIRYLLSGGDTVNPGSIAQLLSSHNDLVFINGYGPTESTTFAVCNRIESSSQLTSGLNVIGSPISNTKAYILDWGTTNVKGIGCPGELCLSGPGLAKGYLGNEELSLQKFQDNPFDQGAYDRIYRTGDEARWLPDGRIEFLGRKDNQVKIRGFRIEPGEIEAVLSDCTQVSQAVVKVMENEQIGKALLAYIVPKGEFDKAGIRAYLKEKLPDYMIPQLMVPIDELPLTPNGKIDKRALPEPAYLSKWSQKEYIAPRNEIENQLAQIWKELLGVEQVGVHDNFFELGGHSLLASRVVAAIRERLDINLPLSMLFQYSTIDDLYKYIRMIQKHSSDSNEEEVIVIEI